MASSITIDNPTQNKSCRCAEGDKNIWTAKTSENPDRQPQQCSNCQILKIGTLFLSSKGIGWTSWKKRWFVLTRTSLVFYRNDPNAPPQKGSEANPPLGGIDLNTSGSVVVKADKKLLTVLFPDGRDGRTFTLKAETSEELQEWKTALENALAQAPSEPNVMGQSGILRNEAGDSLEASEIGKRSMKSTVIGRPVLLALEEVDGSPSFLEKALRFIEDYGIQVEGILRQSADVEEVERRVRDYEQGKVEFTADEDAHVIGDCIKHVLRELPSSPVPATCCTALVEAYRTGRGNRINAIRSAIYETFPEPNRLLLQRILKMMRTVGSYRSSNRMTPSGLAACMAPLLLRPLLAGDCEFEDDFNMGGDGSIQLLKAAAAANHAQAIVIILLEDYDRIFDDELYDGSSDIYTESGEEEEYEIDDDDDDDEGEEDEDDDDDDEDDDDEDDLEDDFSTDNDMVDLSGYLDAQNGVEADIEDDFTGSSSGSLSRSASDVDSVSSDNKSIGDQSIDSSSPKHDKKSEATEKLESSPHTSTMQKETSEHQKTDSPTADLDDNILMDDANSKTSRSQQDHKPFRGVDTPSNQMQKCISQNIPSSTTKFPEKQMYSMSTSRRHAWGRAPARRNHSMESIDLSNEDEVAIERLETTIEDLQAEIANEVKENSALQVSLERKKEALHSRRSALEKEVARLQEQLDKERDLGTALESGLGNDGPEHMTIPYTINRKTREDLEEINMAEEDIISLNQKVADLLEKLINQALCESCSQRLHAIEEKNKQEIADRKSSNVVNLPTVSSEEFQEQMEDSFSHPEKTSQTTSSGHIGALTANKFSNRDRSIVSRVTHDELNTESKKLSSSLSNRQLKKKFSTKKHNRRKSQDFGSITSTQEQIPVKKTARATSISKDENYLSGEEPDEFNGQNSYSSEDKLQSKMPQHHENYTSGDEQERQLSKNLMPSDESSTTACDTSKNSTSIGENSGPGKDTVSGRAIMQDSHSKNYSVSRSENPKLGVDTDKWKVHYENQVSPVHRQGSRRPPNAMYQGSKKSYNPPSSEEQPAFNRTSASKKTKSWDEILREPPGSPSLKKKKGTQKLQGGPSTASSLKQVGSSEDATGGSNVAVKKSVRPEEMQPSSSTALTRLTNRLNFLKERRVQLVNELQNLDTTRASGSEAPPNNSR